MKYIKTYEKLKSNHSLPRIGDYVICQEKNDINTETINQKLKYNIGQIIDKPEDTVGWNVEDNNELAKKYFWVYFETIDDKINFPQHVRPFYRSEIIMCSKDKADLDAYLDANLYNL